MNQYETRASLLSRVRNLDDHEAWREFDERYRELILRYCRRRGLQQSDAEDVRQMVMLNLAKQLRTFKYQPERGRFRGYMGQTVANAISRYFRRPRPENHGLDSNVTADLATDEGAELDREWEEEWMLYHYRLAMQRVRQTSENKSVEVFEHLLGGETPDQVAERFQMTRDAVHKVKQRMRDRLKELVAVQIHEEENVGTESVN
jgi:RNA polymerase sigma factor (sigma-70 family)